MNIKKSIVLRIRIAFLVMFVFALAIVVKLNTIQWVQGEMWREKANKFTFQFRPVKATRGNIYSDNGSLLATSLPFYQVAFDPTVPSDEVFKKGVDSLSIQLAKFFGDRSVNSYKNMLLDARKEDKRYVLVNRKQITYHNKKQIENWPIFREGRYKGGVIFEKVDRRFKPFNQLSDRTVGFINENQRGAGLEYSFNSELAGKDGEAMFQKLSGGNWKPLFDGDEVKSEDGMNIHTTLDVNLQDVTETALRRSLMEHQADYGLVIVMEVSTGKIKAISNLSKVGESYNETYNYAIGGLHEPGSTIKLATMLALLEETNISLGDSIDTGNGEYKIYNNRVKDHHEGGWGKLTIKEAFEKSSNVAMVKLVEEHFGLKPEKFIQYLDQLHMTQPLDFQIKGGGVPKVIRPGEPGWSGITLPWMAHGYGLEVSPLHTLTLFNAVANNGKMIKPIIVSEMGYTDSKVKRFKTEVLNEKICSEKTLNRLKMMLEGVVENGTAENIKGTHYKIAGKTGTAQILDEGTYSARYITSFAGYFPADKPKYSAIVLIKNPKGWRQYGSNVAAPVFKEIADNIYARDLELHEVFAVNKLVENTGVFPVIRSGNAEEIEMICNAIGVSNHKQTDQTWVKTQIKGNAVQLVSNNSKVGTIPNVVGMTLRDAIYLLESTGIRVESHGRGRVTSQSILPGAQARNFSVIDLNLDL